jgi:hypothetical protein
MRPACRVLRREIPMSRTAAPPTAGTNTPIDLKKGPTGRINGLTEVLAGVTREDVLNVLSGFSMSEVGHYGYADSTDFDLVYAGMCFPPKAVLGLASGRAVGRPLTSDEFSGGEGSPCFRVLRSLGFTIEPKAAQTSGRGTVVGSAYPFEVGQKYLRRDVFAVIGIDDPSGGPWYTGYTQHGDDWFIFCGVGAAGRTGHDYHNRFLGNALLWYGKTGSSIRQPSIQGLVAPRGFTYIFCRECQWQSKFPHLR